MVGKNIGAILTMNNLTVSIISHEGFYYLFDSHSRDEVGRVTSSNGKSCVCYFEDLEQLHMMLLHNMYIVNENGVSDVENMRMNAYVISTIKVTSFNVNGKENQMSDCLLNQTLDIFASFMTNKTSESMKHGSHKDPPPKNPPTLNNKRASSSDSPKKSKKKKKRRGIRLRSSFVSDKHTKLIFHNKYVNTKVNTYFYEHRLNLLNNCCRSLECKANYIGPIMNGLQCTLLYECSACDYDFTILSEPEANNIVSTYDSIVLGCISSGIGFYQLESLLTAADF